MTNQWKRLTLAAMGGIVATGITFGVVSTTFAQDQTPDTTARPGLTQPGFKAGPRFGGMAGFGGFGLHGNALATIASTLKISEADLQTALQSGKSIADIAAEKSVALDTVINALVAEQKAALTEAVTNERLTQAQADGVLANLQENLPELLNLKPLPASLGLHQRPDGGQRGPGGMLGERGVRGFSLTTLAETLKLTNDELQTELQRGKSVADIAAEQNVALDTVIDALVAERSTQLAQAVTDGKLTQAQADEQLAQFEERLPDMLQNALPTGGPGFGPGRGSPGFGPGRGDPGFGPGRGGPGFGPGRGGPGFGPGRGDPDFGPGRGGQRAPQTPAAPTEAPSDQSSDVPFVPEDAGNV